MGSLERVDGGPASEKSLRDYFAAQVLAKAAELTDAEKAAKVAYEIADAMLAERRKAVNP